MKLLKCDSCGDYAGSNPCMICEPLINDFAIVRAAIAEAMLPAGQKEKARFALDRLMKSVLPLLYRTEGGRGA